MNRSIVLLLLACPLPAFATGKVLPVLNHLVPDVSTANELPATTIPLDQYFGTEPIDDQVVRFSYQPSAAGSPPVLIDMAMFSTRTPVTRTNFLKYVTDGDYNRSIIHRRATNFVLQGGGFTVDTANVIHAVPTDPAIVNEFGVSNTAQTVSMAKSDGNPNSATSQWFISLAANSDNLDFQNGGFAVFGRVTKSTWPAAISFTDFANFPLFNLGGAFTSTPLDKSYLVGDAYKTRFPNLNEWVLFPTVTLASLPDADAGQSTALTYSAITSVQNGVASVSIQGSALIVTPASNQTGTISVKVTATDSVGNTVDDIFTVTVVKETYAMWRTATFSAADAANDAVSGPAADPDGDGITNLELFLHGLPLGATSKPPVTSVDFSDGTARRPRFTFPIRNDITGVSYVIEKTATLTDSASWTTAPMTEISRTTAATIDTVTIQPTDAVSATPVFYRVRFSLQ